MTKPMKVDAVSPKYDPRRWVDEHGDCLYRYALARVRMPEVAKDLVQETLLVGIRSLEKFEGRSSERSWLVTHKTEFWQTMRDCLSKLPRRHSVVFILREIDGMSTQEICRTVSISEDNLWVIRRAWRCANLLKEIGSRSSQ